MWIEFNTETSAVVTVLVQTGGAGLRNTRAMTTTAAAAVVLILPLVLATCGHAKLTDKSEHINNYGSCPLKKVGLEDWVGPKSEAPPPRWSFDTQPCGYPSVTCMDTSPDMANCDNPFPDANIYHKDETVIATYFDGPLEDGTKSAPCPLNLTYQSSFSDYKKVTESFDCPVTCYDCANLCRVQAMSVAKADQKYDPTMQGCNAWVFCTNPDGCANGKKTVPAFSCTLKRIPLDNPDIQKLMKAQPSGDEQFGTEPPAGLVAGGSSDFVSGLCNIRETCVNTESVRDRCDSGCGNEQEYICGGYPMTCSDGCIPSCPC